MVGNGAEGVGLNELLAPWRAHYMKPNILGGPIGSDTERMLDVYMTRDQREAYERLRKDAERYRWLREGDNDELVMRYYDGSPVPVMHPDKHAPCYVLRLGLLDKAIDAAMNGANGRIEPDRCE